MTADPFTTAARAEAERRVMGDSRFAHTTRDLLVGMAEWARTYLAEQEANDDEQPRALTPDDISDDDYERGVPVLRTAPQKPSVMVAHETVRAIVAAVLTEPTRPEGAEGVRAQS